jgi:hypothetical protein
MVVSQLGIHHSSFGSYLEINMFLRLGQMFFYIVVEGGLVAQMDWLNTKGFDPKLDTIKFWTHNVWFCSWQQT